MDNVLSYFTLKGENIPIRDAETYEKLNNEIRDRKDENIKTNIRINNVEVNAETANEIANSANSKADSAITAANTAKSTADSANTTANTAKSTADSAKSTANTAKSTADSASTTANTAIKVANSASTTADSAKSTANSALNVANNKMNAKIGFSSFMLASNLVLASGATKTISGTIYKSGYVPISMRYEITGSASSFINVYSEILSAETCSLTLRNLYTGNASINVKVTVYYAPATYTRL